ncbi:hypothetical protein U9K52_09845 [Chryseobacterium sp. MHB01]|uniref:hypothetical protein n=1 Tax=Chryseobacterium sp. MHB01 TaxID=3109433 RepID=UPI002AFE56C1|nr:hypothetical protein [Chryseobacterium sp. MHB01]MEA1849214.1 hypothetical protein [Chryseobacterium sp. MHB01]
MKKILEACNDIRPVTVPICAFMAGIFYAEKIWIGFALLTIMVIMNIPFLKNKSDGRSKTNDK